jgi:predicted metal-dependent phosphoesterase TrpH
VPEAEGVTYRGTLVDMHTHTVLGAYDSGMRPERLMSDARDLGLGGVTVTEHDRMWDTHTLRRYRDEHSALVVANGMEVTTDMGHILAYGLSGYTSGIHSLARLREAADECGGYLVAAHPFRYWFEPVHFTRRGLQPVEMVAEVLAKQPVFRYVDAIEVYNGANSERENLMALEVALYLGKPGIAGSDCHSAAGIGCACTLFERGLETPEMLLLELRAGRYMPMRNHASGELRPFAAGDAVQPELTPPPLVSD